MPWNSVSRSAFRKPRTRERVERELEKVGIPAVEEIPGHREMFGTTAGDAIELAFQPGHVAWFPQMQIRQVRDHTRSVRAYRKEIKEIRSKSDSSSQEYHAVTRPG